MNFASIDWQAIGTWFTGIAITVFAFLTWKLSQRQQQLLYSSKLEGYARYDPPKTGSDVFINGHTHYDGIAWEVSVISPGALPIIVTDTNISIKSAKTGKSIRIWPGPHCAVFTRTGNAIRVARPRLTATAGSPIVRTIVVHNSRFQDILEPVSGQGKSYSLEVDFFWNLAGNRKNITISSQEFTLTGDEPFGKRVLV